MTKTIVYLIAGTFNAGGMERAMTGKANWLARHGYDVSIVTTDQRRRPHYFPLDERIRTYDLGINYDETNGSLIRKLATFPFKQWRHRKRLTALLKQLKADVVICMFNNDVSFVHKIQDGSRKVLEIHFSKNKKLQYGRQGLWALADRWRTWREEKVVRKYDRFVVLTHEDAALWGKLPNICVIPNARTFSPDRQADLNRKQVLAIGRYDYQKGFDRLIDIWNRVLWLEGSKARGWQLVIVGDGPLRQQLQHQLQSLGLEDSVRLMPPTSDIQTLYLQSSVFVLTSRYEGLPMVLLEAQACGLPIVAFACQCGPRDIITDGSDGFLIAEKKRLLFAQQLSALMQDPDLRQRMGENARQSSLRFSEDCIMKQWESLLS